MRAPEGPFQPMLGVVLTRRAEVAVGGCVFISSWDGKYW